MPAEVWPSRWCEGVLAGWLGLFCADFFAILATKALIKALINALKNGGIARERERERKTPR